ncbi:hypothetical protein GGF32_006530 [Allomyces javanicus]|nr:hypothetical protein GGF32_006530 [Allomyces javanicus]
MSAETQEKASLFKVALLALPWIGVQAIWQVEFGIVTPVLEAYGLDPALSSVIWIFGPITGFFTAPIVGSLSDQSTMRLGRRRPFLLGGLLSTLIASAIFSVTYLMGSAKQVVGFLAFIMLDITINFMQTPLRSLGADMVPESQQSTVQLMSAFCQGLGAMLGFGLMRAMWSSEPHQMPGLFAVVMGLNVVFLGATCYFVHEKHQTKDQVTKSSVVETLTKVIHGVKDMERPIAVICAIEFFSWLALFAWWPTASTWFSRNVYDGCQLSDKAGCTDEGFAKYTAGDNAYSESGIYANLLQTIFSLALALAMNHGILRRVKIPYFICLIVGAVFLILAKIISGSHTFGFIVAIGMAIPISSINSFPFAIVGKHNAERAAANKSDGKEEESSVGLQMGLLNLFICMPQLISTFSVSGMRGSLGNEGLPWALVMAGISLAIAAALTMLIREEEPAAASVAEAAGKA